MDTEIESLRQDMHDLKNLVTVAIIRNDLLELKIKEISEKLDALSPLGLTDV